MLSISAIAKLEKNKVEQDSCWLVLLEIVLSSTESIYLVRNTEDITWNGHTWVSFPFELDEISEDTKGELPTTTLRVSNITRAIQTYLEDYDGGVGMSAIIRVVNSEALDVTEAEVELEMIVQSTDCANDWISFKLGTDSILNQRFPQRRVMKDFCPFQFKGIECAYNGSAYTTCNHSLVDCRARGNSARFGGEPGIVEGGMYINAT